MSLRENLSFESTVTSDTAALHGLVAAMLAAVPRIPCLCDPTRGGLATTLNELATQAGCGMVIRERDLPVKPQVAAACEFLGLDPLYVANEGKLVVIAAMEDSEALLAAMRAHPLGRDAALIGTVVEDPYGFVQMQTTFAGCRNVDWLTGEQLPRICWGGVESERPCSQLRPPRHRAGRSSGSCASSPMCGTARGRSFCCSRSTSS